MNGTPEHSEKTMPGNGMVINLLYRSALLGLSSWVLIAVLKNNDRAITMEGDIKHFNTSVLRIEGNMQSLVTRTELELTVIKLQNEQLKIHNEFLKITQPSALATPQPRHTGR
jgi:hypothetical protein